jgi:hypothetical protein
LAEANLRPIAKCLPTFVPSSKMLINTPKVKATKNAPAKVTDHPDFLVVAVLLIVLVLIILTFALALYINPRLRLWLR